MDNMHQLSPLCEEADYKPQRIPAYIGNPLIEALPSIKTDVELQAMMTQHPAFDSRHRKWPTAERLHLLMELQNFMEPLARNIELARAIDSMIRAGYVGRVPRTIVHTRITQAIHERQATGLQYAFGVNTTPGRLTSAHLGLSGTGKTTNVRRVLAQYPRVIYHPQYNLYQVPYIHTELPSNGASVKGWAFDFIGQLDELIPGCHYYREYVAHGRFGAEQLITIVNHLAHLHGVGILIGDEVQNLANSPLGAKVVMTELVSMSNRLGLPLLFVGTNKASRVLGMNFCDGRRAVGHCIGYWDRLPSAVPEGEVDEWATFMDTLWRFQWVRKPIALTPLLRETIYDCCQGIVDLAIKLFAVSQARAMFDGTETLTAELVMHVYQNDFKPVHPMLSALRDNDLKALLKYDDIRPIDLAEAVRATRRQGDSRSSPLYGVKGDDPEFVPLISASLQAVGLTKQEAEDAANSTIADGQTPNLLSGLKSALQALTARAPVPRAKATQETAPVPSFDERPLDYRRSIAAARANGTTVLAELGRLGMAKPLEEILDLA